jgi:RNA polymerase sigma factor (sigma-70 family)
MANEQLGPVLRQIRQLTSAGAAGDEPDRELLRRYLGRRDEQAFAALVQRHGALVLGVCRSVLRHEQDAEDAFQATFLVLARRAGSIRKGDSVGSWLYGVAYRTALKARRAMARRSKHQRSVEVRTPEQPVSEAALRELQTILHEEVARLPERYRAPFVLCCLEGKSRADAATELGWKEGTVFCRVARAREELRRRLARRGLALTAALGAAALMYPPAEAALPRALAATATRVALAFEAGETGAVPAEAATLARAVLQSMAVRRATTVLGLVLALGLITFGMGFVVYAALPATPPAADEPPRPAPQPAAAGEPLPRGAVRRFGSDRFRHPGHVRASALSPDGTRIATVSPELLQIADTATGEPLRRIPLGATATFAVPGLAFSPDGRYIVCCLHDRLTAVWLVSTGAEVLRIANRRFAYSLCQFTPDGKLVLADNDRTRLLEVPSGKEVGSWPVGRMARLTADAKTFARVEQERVAVVVGEAETGKVTLRLDVSSACNGVEEGLAFSPDGRKLAVVHDCKEIQVWDVPGKSKRMSFPLHKEWIERADPYYTVAFTGDGAEVLFGTKPGAVYHWRVATGDELPWLNVPWGFYVRGLHLLPDGRTLLATEGGGRVVRWDLKKGQHMGDAPGARPPLRIGLTADGTGLVVGDWSGRIDLWEVASGRLLRTLEPGHDMGSALAALAVSPDGQRLATGEGGGTVRLLRLADGKEERAFPSRRKDGGVSIDWLRFTPDGRSLCAGDYGSAVRVWDVTTGLEVWSGESAATAAVSPDGKLLAAARYNEVTIRDAATGMVLRRQLVGPAGRGGYFNAMHALAFSPDDLGLACALEKGQIVLFNPDGKERVRFQAVDRVPGQRIGFPELIYPVTSIAFSPDGHWLASGAGDRAVRVWEAATGKQVLRFDGHFGEVTQVTFTRDGRGVVSAGEDGFAYLWDLLPAAPAADAPAEDLWRDAAADDAEKGVRAAWGLVATTDARRQFLRERLGPASPGVPPERLRRWIADLGDDGFAVREAASRELSAQIRHAEPLLREALRKPRDAETKKRLEGLLALLERGSTPDELRILRLVHAAELADTPSARSLLATWAGGAPEARLTRSARAALARLDRPRPTPAPDR